MTEVNMSASDILERMAQGAKLYRGFGQADAELTIPEKGIVFVPPAIFDSLMSEQKIGPEGGVAAGYYRRLEAK
jgi:hypothetical protein